ncbi:DUF6583 family protein [Oceanobacillus senegalensis]|uniref:DUF6583 family protein n=1 Tax=Oceanobacillus senegalensis TaxID=1936063 RepID=UPI000A306156|nr:DUF6583 family protein [Oceanobacillus senegalensis]
MEDSNKKQGVNKGFIAIIVAAILVIGGSVAAFTLIINTSPKQTYFLAEKNTLEFVGDTIKDRYQAELDWNELSYENPTEQSVKLSAEYNGPTATEGYTTINPAQIINNSSISLKAQADMENKQIASEIALDIAGIKVDGLSAYLTDEKVMVGLPFIEEYLQIKDDDLGPLLKELDPVTFTGDETLELDTLFEKNGGLSDEDLEYLKTEYGKMIYDELPDDAFETTNETIEINGESLDTEKIELHLNEQQVRDLLTTIFEKLENDDRLKEILRTQLTASQIGNPTLDDDVDQILSDFEDGLGQAKEEIQDFHIPNGFTSTIWVHNDMIAKRDMNMELGPDKNNLISFSVNGTQLFTETTQHFNYDFEFADPANQGTMNVTGDLSWDGNNAEDSIKLTAGETTLSYVATETLENGTRNFERTFSFNDGFNDGKLIWDGSSTFESEQMNSEHHLSIETSDMGNLINLQLLVDGNVIESVEMPSEENVKDLGGMSAVELMDYVESELTPRFQQWLFGIMAGGSGF